MTTLQAQRMEKIDHGLPALTPRELEVMRHLASGESKQSTATALGISPHTVNRHTTSLMRKLDVHNRAELTRVALRSGLVDP